MTLELREKQDFLVQIQKICARPAMYVGQTKIKLVTTMISSLAWGYCAGKMGRLDEFSSFRDSLTTEFWKWVPTQLAIPFHHPAWGLDRKLLHSFDHHHSKAISSIPVFYEQWINGAEEEWLSKSPAEKYQERLERLRATYGTPHGAPDCDLCDRGKSTLALKP